MTTLEFWLEIYKTCSPLSKARLKGWYTEHTAESPLPDAGYKKRGNVGGTGSNLENLARFLVGIDKIKKPAGSGWLEPHVAETVGSRRRGLRQIVRGFVCQYL